MYIAILGRQPALGMAEIERLYGANSTKWFSDESAAIYTDRFDFEQLGGSLKAGKVILELNGNWGDASRAIVEHYIKQWSSHTGKITLGISAYGFKASTRDIQKTGIILKQQLKKSKASLRLIPNSYPAHNTATSHHNKLGLAPNKIEVLAVRAGNGAIIIAQSIGAQNISALAGRDQARPHTDAFVGMLPPKLARIMVNLATDGTRARGTSRALGGGAAGTNSLRDKVEGLAPPTILDPFCGTGVVLQESILLGYNAYGTDLSDKMVEFTQKNLHWLIDKFNLPQPNLKVTQADAMNYVWHPPVDAIVCETYLGQPFSAPPRPEKLTEVRGNCNHIIGTFLQNAAKQLDSNTPLVLAVPAWRDKQGNFTHLPLTTNLAKLGYERIKLQRVNNSDLLYYRESQVVARELLILKKI